MRKTEDLINILSQDLSPVERLASPGKRLLFWLAIALPISLILGSVVEQKTLGIDTTQLAVSRLGDMRMVIEIIAIFATAISAGFAALSSAQPGRSKQVWLLPIVPLLTWMALVGEGCWQLWLEIGADKFTLAPHWSCYPSVVATGAVPAIALVLMLRRTTLFNPTVTVGFATLGAAALGAVGLRLFHPPDATVMLMLWQLVATVSFFIISGIVASFLRPAEDSL
ncbi:MAG: NrsF family protein [Rhodospirillaceae bacterium]|nr:NrsF family protein [Rhodospirillaceae bacterium]